MSRPDLLVQSLGGNQFNLIYDNPNYSGTLQLTLHDNSGKELLNDLIAPGSGQRNYELNLNYLAPGIYLLRMGNKDFSLVKKLVVR